MEKQKKHQFLDMPEPKVKAKKAKVVLSDDSEASQSSNNSDSEPKYTRTQNRTKAIKKDKI